MRMDNISIGKSISAEEGGIYFKSLPYENEEMLY